jgi:benzoyl-CoA reductase/2-hydroxyglutaryl-CoA dehydratase subunit BcrC/BadD/HgdB
MEALARRYFELAVPCPTRYDPNQEWGHYLAKAVPEAGAKGLVTMVVKFCEPHMIYYPYLRDVLNEAGVPHLMIETEHEVVSLEGTRTRLQAFIEMLSA